MNTPTKTTQHLTKNFVVFNSMDIINSTINKHCCEMMNHLLTAMNCISPSIASLYELSDGASLAELIDNYESVFNRCDKWDNNYAFIKKWLNNQDIKLPHGRAVKDLLESNHLHHLALICYAVISIFERNGNVLREKISNYTFHADHNSLIGLISYVKWQLCEEEIEIKQKEIDHLRKEIEKLSRENVSARNKVNYLRNSINNMMNNNTINDGPNNTINGDPNNNERIDKSQISKFIADAVLERYNSRKKRVVFGPTNI